jgi:hypothetical protein
MAKCLVTFESHLEELREEMSRRQTPLGVSLGDNFYFAAKKIYRLLAGVLVPANDVKTIVSRSVIRGGGTEEIPFNSHDWGNTEEEFIYLAATEAIEPLELALVEVDPTPVKAIVVVKTQPPVKRRKGKKSDVSQLALLEV